MIWNYVMLIKGAKVQKFIIWVLVLTVNLMTYTGDEVLRKFSFYLTYSWSCFSSVTTLSNSGFTCFVHIWLLIPSINLLKVQSLNICFFYLVLLPLFAWLPQSLKWPHKNRQSTIERKSLQTNRTVHDI